MKKLLVILFAVILMLTGCQYAEDWVDTLSVTEEPLGEIVTRTPVPTSVPTEASKATPTLMPTNVPAATPVDVNADPFVTVKDGVTSVTSKSFNIKVSVFNPNWTCDPAWDKAQGLTTDFIFFHYTAQSSGNLVGVITYTFDEGDMEEIMEQKIASVMDGVTDYTRETIEVGGIVAVRITREISNGSSAYIANNVFWCDGRQLNRITSASQSGDADEVWGVVMDILNSFELYEG